MKIKTVPKRVISLILSLMLFGSMAMPVYADSRSITTVDPKNNSQWIKEDSRKEIEKAFLYLVCKDNVAEFHLKAKFADSYNRNAYPVIWFSSSDSNGQGTNTSKDLDVYTGEFEYKWSVPAPSENTSYTVAIGTYERGLTDNNGTTYELCTYEKATNFQLTPSMFDDSSTSQATFAFSDNAYYYTYIPENVSRDSAAGVPLDEEEENDWGSFGGGIYPDCNKSDYGWTAESSRNEITDASLHLITMAEGGKAEVSAKFSDSYSRGGYPVMWLFKKMQGSTEFGKPIVNAQKITSGNISFTFGVNAPSYDEEYAIVLGTYKKRTSLDGIPYELYTAEKELFFTLSPSMFTEGAVITHLDFNDNAARYEKIADEPNGVNAKIAIDTDKISYNPASGEYTINVDYTLMGSKGGLVFIGFGDENKSTYNVAMATSVNNGSNTLSYTIKPTGYFSSLEYIYAKLSAIPNYSTDGSLKDYAEIKVPNIYYSSSTPSKPTTPEYSGTWEGTRDFVTIDWSTYSYSSSVGNYTVDVSYNLESCDEGYVSIYFQEDNKASPISQPVSKGNGKVTFTYKEQGSGVTAVDAHIHEKIPGSDYLDSKCITFMYVTAHKNDYVIIDPSSIVYDRTTGVYSANVAYNLESYDEAYISFGNGGYTDGGSWLNIGDYGKATRVSRGSGVVPMTFIDTEKRFAQCAYAELTATNSMYENELYASDIVAFDYKGTDTRKDTVVITNVVYDSSTGTYTAVISYDLVTKDKGIIYLGFGSANGYNIRSNVEVEKGKGTVTLKGIPLGTDSLDLLYANLSENPHPSEWDPLAVDSSSLSGIAPEEKPSNTPIKDAPTSNGPSTSNNNNNTPRNPVVTKKKNPNNKDFNLKNDSDLDVMKIDVDLEDPDRVIDIHIDRHETPSPEVKKLIDVYAAENNDTKYAYIPMDISIYDFKTEEKITELGKNEGITFSLSIPDEFYKYRNRIKVLHVDNGELETLPSTIVVNKKTGKKGVQFKMRKFSPVNLYVDADGMSDEEFEDIRSYAWVTDKSSDLFGMDSGSGLIETASYLASESKGAKAVYTVYEIIRAADTSESDKKSEE